jgi:hypothetical protein
MVRWASEGTMGVARHVRVLSAIPIKARAFLIQAAVAILLVCLGVVIGKTLVWVGIAVALTVVALLALATLLESPQGKDASRTKRQIPSHPESALPPNPQRTREDTLRALSAEAGSPIVRAGQEQAIKALEAQQTRERRQQAAAKVIERSRREDQEHPANESARPLADRLGHLHSEGRQIRQRIKPDHPSPFVMLAQAGVFSFPNASMSSERAALRWHEEVRNQLTLGHRDLCRNGKARHACLSPQSRSVAWWPTGAL